MMIRYPYKHAAGLLCGQPVDIGQFVAETSNIAKRANDMEREIISLRAQVIRLEAENKFLTTLHVREDAT